MTLRPPRDDEFDAMLELMNAHQLAAFGEADYTADDLRTWLTTPYVEVDRDIRVLERDGRLIGYADADPNARRPAALVVRRQGRPGRGRRRGRAELVAWLEERAVEGRLRVWTSEDDGRIVERVHALGFEPVRHSYRMEIDLDDEAREPTWPEGISVRTATDGDHRLVYDAVIEVWQDTNDPIDETFEEWAHWHVERDSYDPTLWFLAFAGDELAGFSLCRQRSGRPERRLRQHARRPAGLAAAGSRRGAPPPLVRGVPRARPDARDARRRRIERHRCDPPLRARGNARLPRHGLSRTPGAGVAVSVLRSPREEEAGAIAALLSAHAPEPISEERVRRSWGAPGVDIDRDVRVAVADDVILGFAAVKVEDVHTWIELHGQGRLAELIDWATSLARGRAYAGGWQANGEVRAALLQKGFELVRHSYRMAIDLDEESPKPRWPDGVRVRSFREGEGQAVHETHMETFEDSWEHTHAPYDEWAH